MTAVSKRRTGDGTCCYFFFLLVSRYQASLQAWETLHRLATRQPKRSVKQRSKDYKTFTCLFSPFLYTNVAYLYGQSCVPRSPHRCTASDQVNSTIKFNKNRHLMLLRVRKFEAKISTHLHASTSGGITAFEPP
jgi:hypothetical protein